MSNNVVMIVSAHPDDAEMSMGGTLVRFAKSGIKLCHLCLTRGDRGTYGTPETRTAEFRKACDYLGCEGLMLDFPDTQLEDTVETRTAVARQIRLWRPHIVFAPYHTNTAAEPGGIANRDHYTAGTIVRDAIKLARLEKAVDGVAKHEVRNSFFYMLPRQVLPSLIVDVSPVIEETKQLIKCYETQLQIKIRGTEVEHSLLTRRASNGLMFGMRYAEGFVTDMPLVATPEMLLEF